MKYLKISEQTGPGILNIIINNDVIVFLRCIPLVVTYNYDDV